jgi:hypothetical protein
MFAPRLAKDATDLAALSTDFIDDVQHDRDVDAQCECPLTVVLDRPSCAGTSESAVLLLTSIGSNTDPASRRTPIDRPARKMRRTALGRRVPRSPFVSWSLLGTLQDVYESLPNTSEPPTSRASVTPAPVIANMISATLAATGYEPRE